MNYLVALGIDAPSDRIDAMDILAQSVWQMKGLGVQVVRESTTLVSPATPEGAGPDILSTVLLVSTEQRVESLSSKVRGLIAAARANGAGLFIEVLQEGDAPRAHALQILSGIAEVSPQWRHPATGETAAEMLAKQPTPLRARIRAANDDNAPRRDVAE